MIRIKTTINNVNIFRFFDDAYDDNSPVTEWSAIVNADPEEMEQTVDSDTDLPAAFVFSRGKSCRIVFVNFPLADSFTFIIILDVTSYHNYQFKISE